MQESYITRMNQAISHKRYFVDIIQKLHEKKGHTTLLEEIFEKKSMVDVNIVDYGCGSGLLTSVIAEEFSGANVVGYDRSLDMIEIARERFSGRNLYFTSDIRNIKEHSCDYIVLSSVLHEIYSEFDNLSFVNSFLNSLTFYLKPGGYIISRDNHVFDSTGANTIKMSFTTNKRANCAFDFMGKIHKSNPEKTIKYYGAIIIDTEKNIIMGSERGVKEFLNKFTWGEESLPRESQESLFCFSPKDWRSIAPTCYNIVAQYDYIDSSYLSHLRNIVEIPESFPTHQWTILQLSSPNV